MAEVVVFSWRRWMCDNCGRAVDVPYVLEQNPADPLGAWSTPTRLGCHLPGPASSPGGCDGVNPYAGHKIMGWWEAWYRIDIQHPSADVNFMFEDDHRGEWELPIPVPT